MFFTKYTLFAEKNNFTWKKKFILIFVFLLKKTVFTENEKKIYLDHKKKLKTSW